MNESKARELAADVLKLHTPDRPPVTSERAPSELKANSARCSVSVGSPPCSFYYPLFEHMSREHGLTLLDSELAEIARIAGPLTAHAKALEDLRQTVGGYLHGGEWDHWQKRHASRFAELANVEDERRRSPSAPQPDGRA